ncbi:MAG: hypothetical protein ABI165_03240 [Bryobacteraceae bacterium]
MSDQMGLELLIASGAELPEAGAVRASSRLKSRIYSRLVQEQAADGPLLSLSKTKAAGRALCVFENLVQIAPVGETAGRANYCRVCHARVAGERIESAPIYWPHCPYVLFQNR